MDSSFLSRTPTFERTLGNGLRVLVREDHSAPVVAIMTYVKAGYFDEADDVVGISHVLEHMFFKGTPSLGVGEIARETKLAGGYLNAGTIYDHTRYYNVLPSSSTLRGLEIQADALQHSLIDAGELERELRVIIQEANRKLDNPDAVARETLFATMFDEHPIRRWRIGSEAVLSGFTRTDVEHFYRAHYTAPNTILVVAGDVNADEVFAAAERLYGGMPADAAPARTLPAEPPLTGARYREMTGDIAQTHVEWGWRVPDALHEDVPALDVLAVVLGSGRASLLYRHVRDAGLASSVSAWNYTPGDIGIFGISAEVKPEDTAAAVRRMGDVLQHVRHEGFTDVEVERARNVIEARLLRRLETAEGQANLLAEWEALGGWRDVEAYHANVMRVTAAQVQACARRWLAPDAVTALIYRPAAAEPVAADAAAFHAMTFGAMAAAGIDAEAEVAEADMAAVPGPAAAANPLEPERDRSTIGMKHAASLAPVHIEDDVRFYVVAEGNARVIIRQRHSSPLVSMGLYCRGGMLSESEATRGLTAWVSRTSVKGTHTRSAVQLATATEALGGSISPGAGADMLEWSLSVPSRHLGPALELLLDASLHPRLDAEDAERERKLMLASLEQLRDDMHQYPLRLALAAGFGEHPYGADVAAMERALREADPAALTGWHGARVLRGHPYLIIVGDVEAPDAVAAMADRLLLGNVAEAVPLDATPAGWTDVVVTRAELRERAQTALALAFPGPPRSHRDVYALNLLSAAISGLGGRLFEELRSRRSLAYSVSVAPLPRWVGGAVLAYIGTAPEREAEARDALMAELLRSGTELLPADELERARKYLLGAWQIRQQTNARQVADLAAALMLGEGLAELREYGERLQAVTAEDVRAAAERWLCADRVAEGIVRGRSTGG